VSLPTLEMSTSRKVQDSRSSIKISKKVDAEQKALSAVLLPRDAAHSAVMRQYIMNHLPVCLSVRPSVTFRYDFHTGYSLRLLFGLTPLHGQPGPTGTPPKLGE